MNVAASLLAGSLLLLPLAAQQQPSAKGVNFYSLDRELQIGRDEAARLIPALPVVRVPKLDAYCSSLLGELGKHADPRFPYSFTVYDDRTPFAAPWVPMDMPLDAFRWPAGEAVTLPGGSILIPLRLIAEAPDEAALVFQLAHAMAHAALRHSTRLATREDLMQMATIPLAEMQRVSTPAAAVALSAGQSAAQLGMLSLARQFELAADTMAAAMMADAGYDPARAIAYLEGQSPADVSGPRVFAPRPTTARRIEAVRTKMESLPVGVYNAQTGAFEEIKALAVGAGR